MPTWTIATALDRCGYDGATIGDGAPMALVGPADWPTWKRKRRCAAHAHGPIDWQAVDAATHAREAQQAAAAAPSPVPTPSARVPRRSGFAPISASAAGVFDLFDSKAAAAGKDE